MNNDAAYLLNYEHSSDLCELRAKISKLKVEAQNSLEKDEATLIEEKSQDFIKRLQESDEHLFSLTNKLRTLTGNYAAFSSVLELKQELSCQVENLKAKNAEITEKYNLEVEKLKKELEKTKDTWANILTHAHEENGKKLEDVENSWKEKLCLEEAESNSLRLNLKEANDEYGSNIKKMKRQHHDELENLRIQIEIHQRSSSSSSNLDIYAQKLFSAQAEFDKSILEKDNMINDLKSKLKEAEDNIRHMKLLSVVRSAQKVPPSSQQPPTCLRQEEKRPSLSIPKRNELFIHNDKEFHFESNKASISSGQNMEHKKKFTKKRKLFSKESSFLSDTPE